MNFRFDIRQTIFYLVLQKKRGRIRLVIGPDPEFLPVFLPSELFVETFKIRAIEIYTSYGIRIAILSATVLIHLEVWHQRIDYPFRQFRPEQVF